MLNLDLENLSYLTTGHISMLRKIDNDDEGNEDEKNMINNNNNSKNNNL